MSFVAATLAFAARRRWLIILSTAALAIASTVMAFRVSFETDVLGLLPRDSRSVAGFRHYLERFGDINHLYIVFSVPEGEHIEDASSLVDRYVADLRAVNEIGEVDAGLEDSAADWTYLQDRLLILAGPTAAQKALERFKDGPMREALGRSRDLLTAPSSDVRKMVETDPLGLLMLVRERFATDRAALRLAENARGYVSADGRSRLVIATPTLPPFDSDFCRTLFDRLADVETEARRHASAASPGTDNVAIAYAGGHRIALETESTIRREATWNTVTSVAAILLLLLAVFRSPWLFFVGALPMLVATVASIAINGAIFGRLSAAATGTSALLFGLGIDGLVLLYARHLEEQQSGASREASIAGLANAGTSMLLGCLTTAATFLALTWIDLPGLQELGRLVGIGMLLGGPLTLVLVPALLPARLQRRSALSWTWLPRFVRRRRVLILIAAAGLTLAAIPLAMRLDFDLRIQRLQPDAPAIRLQKDLAARFGIDRDVAMVVATGPDLERLLDIDHRLQERLASESPRLAASGPSRILPPAAEQAETGRLVAATAHRVPEIQTRLRDLAFEEGFRRGVVDEFSARIPRLLDEQQRLTYQGYLDHGLSKLASRYVARDTTGYTTVAYVEVSGAGDVARVSTLAASVDPSLTVTGIPVINVDFAERFSVRFSAALAAGAAVVFVLMWVTFRAAGPAFLAIVPTVLGLVWAAAVLRMLGVSLDLFGIFAILTLIGIGVDYGVHLVHRWASNPQDLDGAVSRVAPSNVVAAGIAVLGCGSLATSSYPPLRSLGILTVVGLITCLLGAVLVLPALLASVGARGRPKP